MTNPSVIQNITVWARRFNLINVFAVSDAAIACERVFPGSVLYGPLAVVINAVVVTRHPRLSGDVARGISLYVAAAIADIVRGDIASDSHAGTIAVAALNKRYIRRGANKIVTSVMPHLELANCLISEAISLRSKDHEQANSISPLARAIIKGCLR